MTGTVAGEVQVRVAAPPVDGKANRELLRFLARTLQIPRSRVMLERGSGSRHKVVTVEGLELAEVMRRLRCSDVHPSPEAGQSSWTAEITS